MIKKIIAVQIMLFILGTIMSCKNSDVSIMNSHSVLVELYHDWRAFQGDVFTDGVPDYSDERMKKQYNEFPSYKNRLANFDTTGWTIPHRIDYHLVLAEMNGLDFDHRVIQPWKRSPAFYGIVWDYQSDTPAHEGSVAHGLVELWTYDYPLSHTDAEKLTQRLHTVPPFLAQAKINLTGNARDLWRGGIYRMKSQVNALTELLKKTDSTSDALTKAINDAIIATNGFVTWLERELPSKDGKSGIGIDNYNWYLKNVHLVPYSWKEVETMMRRELVRAHSSLKLEEHRNQDLPPLIPMASKEEYEKKTNASVTEFVSLLRDKNIVPMKDYMDRALRERISPYSPIEPREFFSEVIFHDPMVMRTHFYHWFDLARMRDEPHSSPIRSNPLLYNIWDSRSEGLATGMEEMMMHAGLFDHHPRARELFHILLAQRAARALGDLMMHADKWDIDQAVDFTSRNTPRNWLRQDGRTVVFEQHLYLQQPSYGTTYLVGKIQIERLMTDRAMDLGEGFTLKGFMDEINQVGLIPASMMYWEMTGNDEHLHEMLYN
tara:strand:- start:2495 stop:4135 length:1641 start_codon:yes stop_codon:yes gene_type:complete